MSYETTYPWEDVCGSTLERTLDVSSEAQRVYAQQEALLPTLRLERPADPVASKHLQDVGRRVLILRDTARRARNKRVKTPQSPQSRQRPVIASPKRVIPSRFPEVVGDTDDEDTGGAEDPNASQQTEDPDMLDGRIATMLLDQEWDTRAWNTTKVRAAVEKLYEEIEHCEVDARRDLATTMLLRLLETHEDAVEHVETTLPVLVNKAFRTLSKLTNNTEIFRVARLVAVLSEWFARVLSSENAANRSLNCLLRETELCARILQHHWRGVLFERTLHERDYDPGVRTRLRSMHLVKFVELRHQFKVFREAVGPDGIPLSVTQAYITVLFHLVKLPRGEIVSDKARNATLADQKRVLASGALVYLVSLITRNQSRQVIELVKGITYEIAECHGGDRISDILRCNVVERVTRDMRGIMLPCGEDALEVFRAIESSLRLLAIVSAKVLEAAQMWEQPDSAPPCTPQRLGSSRSTLTASRSSPGRLSTQPPDAEERNFLLRRLKTTALQFLLQAEVFDTLFETLHFCKHQLSNTLRAQVLDILCLLARSTFGFPPLLDALTRDGGRWLESVLLCLKEDSSAVVKAAVALFYEMTNRQDARHGFTTAGAVQTFMRWCQPLDLAASPTPQAFVMGLIGCALLARQTDDAKPATRLLEALETLETRLDALYTLLLDLALQDEATARASERSANYFFSTNALQTLVAFLTQCSPSCMESPFQNARQRNVSCVLLGRFCQVSQVARVCFSEDVVIHLALAIQCNRLDEIEGLVACSPSDERFVHQLGTKEACKALSCLARCPSNLVDARLRPSLTSNQVPEWPQAVICDVMFRLHVLEDLIALLRTPTDAAEFVELELTKVLAAVELVGYLRPLPYGDAARDRFLKTHANHLHGKYSQEKLQQLVELVAPAILHLLREKSASFELVSACCAALSRLACTNAACSLLLTQGTLQTALVHLPEILFPTNGAKSPNRSSIEIDAAVDDHGLLDVPAALYTLFSKLCAVPDGRTGVMRAQVLPRLLKRMQLKHRHSKDADDECKSEIAVVVTRLAMVNAVEGNTSELFLHFHVLELLAHVLQQHQDLVVSALTSTSSSASIAKRMDDVKRWRLLRHAVGAIAALSQDVLVCVPRVVALNIVKLLSPFLVKLGRGSRDSNSHLEMLQYHAVSIIHAIASYPSGEYHSYLSKAKAVTFSRETQEKKTKTMATGNSTEIGLEANSAPPTVMERVKQIGYDFAMELQNKPLATRDKKSVGELARETLVFINEHQQRQQKRRESVINERSRSLDMPLAPRTPRRRDDRPRKLFPALPLSPIAQPAARSQPTETLMMRKAAQTAVKGAKVAVEPTHSAIVIDCDSPSLVGLNGVDIASTRPPEKDKPRSTAPTSSPQSSQQHFVFTRPKRVSKRGDPDPASGLMLDPLFQPKNARSVLGSRRMQRARIDTDDEISESRFRFSQEIDHFGHFVGVKARRSKKGDRYFPSLGRIVMAETCSSPERVISSDTSER